MNPDTLRVFDVYHHPRYGYQTVRRGFSWLAFWLPSVWAVRRGLGYLTLVLLVATTAMFDVAKFAGQWLSHPWANMALLLALVAVVGYKPGTMGFRWHAQNLEDEGFEYVCTVAAPSRREAVRSAAHHDFDHGAILLTGA